MSGVDYFGSRELTLRPDPLLFSPVTTVYFHFRIQETRCVCRRCLLGITQPHIINYHDTIPQHTHVLFLQTLIPTDAARRLPSPLYRPWSSPQITVVPRGCRGGTAGNPFPVRHHCLRAVYYLFVTTLENASASRSLQLYVQLLECTGSCRVPRDLFIVLFMAQQSLLFYC